MTIFTMFSNSVQVSRLRDSTNLRRDLLERHCDHGQHIFCQYHLQNVSGLGEEVEWFFVKPASELLCLVPRSFYCSLTVGVLQFWHWYFNECRINFFENMLIVLAYSPGWKSNWWVPSLTFDMIFNRFLKSENATLYNRMHSTALWWRSTTRGRHWKLCIHHNNILKNPTDSNDNGFT